MNRFELSPLPYDYSALTPIISAETLQFHHDKHHKAYVDKLNELLPGSGFEDAPLEKIIKQATGTIFNQAGQVWNHDFYWRSMAPNSEQKQPQGKLLEAIGQHFGTLDDFKAKFEQLGTTLFGSGWVWLCTDASGKLTIEQTKDADTPVRRDLTPLFTCDVWEHAYYIDYRNARGQYLKKFWGVLNWGFAEKNLQNVRR